MSPPLKLLPPQLQAGTDRVTSTETLVGRPSRSHKALTHTRLQTLDLTAAHVMFSTLEMDLRPGSGLGMCEIGEQRPVSSHFILDEMLGPSLWTVLDILRGAQHFFPQVDLKYDPDSPTTPLILHLRPHLDLLFTGYQQRLHTISVRKLRDPHPPLTITYKKAILSSNDEVLRRVGVSRMFGPTYPGDDLRYPGVSFSFEEDGRGETLKSPVSLPDDRQQEVKRVIVAQKSVDGEQRDALDEVTECPVMAGELSQAILKVNKLMYLPSIVVQLHGRFMKV